MAKISYSGIQAYQASPRAFQHQMMAPDWSLIEELAEARKDKRFWRAVALGAIIFAIVLTLLQPHWRCYEDESCEVQTTLSD